jgi:hypothetical protein
MPELEARGWRKRLDLASLVFDERWGHSQRHGAPTETAI